DWRLRRIDELSKGMQQKVQFISTILHQPELVVLDEPFAGLDPVNTQVLKDTVLELRRRGVTILFSTHIMEQAEKLCDELCIIARGRRLVEGAVSDIKRTHSGHHLTIGFDGSPGRATQIFADKALVKKVDDYGQYAELELAAGADAQQILRELIGSGARLSRFELMEPSLNRGSTFAVVARVSPRAGLMDSLAQQVGLHRLEGFLFVKDATVETGAAEYRAANVSAFRDVAELQGVLGRLAVNERLERAGVDPATVSRAQLRIRLETKKIAGAKTTGESSAESFSLAYVMAIVSFVAIAVYGVNVMSSVLEEKTTRIVEVLVSSLPAFQL